MRVRACAVNRVDLYVRAGVRGTRRSFEGPHILGGDVAGDVVEVGAEVTRARPGDRVVVNLRLTCGQCQSCIAGEEELCIRPKSLDSTNSGGYSEYVAVPGINTVALPDSISYEQAASLPTVFLPCWSILIRRGGAEAVGDHADPLSLQRRGNGGDTGGQKRHRGQGHRHHQHRGQGSKGEGAGRGRGDQLFQGGHSRAGEGGDRRARG